MRYFWMTGVSVVAVGLAVAGLMSPAGAQEAGGRVAAGPAIGDNVDVGLVQEARFAVPAQAKGAPQGGTVQSFSGKLLQFDNYWVGVEAPGSGAKIWVARENVAYLLVKPPGVAGQQQQQPDQPGNP